LVGLGQMREGFWLAVEQRRATLLELRLGDPRLRERARRAGPLLGESSLLFRETGLLFREPGLMLGQMRPRRRSILEQPDGDEE
jgi:hypothetical protein